LKTVGAARHLKVQLWSVNQRTMEADEPPLLRFVTWKRLVKTLQRNSILESCYQITTSESRLRRLSVEIRNSVITICSYDLKWSINLFTDLNPIYSH
jgi:ribosomal protein L20A (L18A)